MRTMMTITIPVAAGNAAITSGKIGPILERAFEQLKPEAAYFSTGHGSRQAMFVFDLADTTDIPSIAEPFFLELEADIKLCPVMNAEDLKAGLAKMAG